VTARRPNLPALALVVSLLAPARGQNPPPAAAADHLKLFQTASVANAREKRDRVYHFGLQGSPGVFSNHQSHSNRLIPFYTFGSKIDPASVTGPRSVYRDASRLKSLYGFLPENTLNPEADYADQSDFAGLLADAVKKGAKHVFIVWFDGLDWPTTQAAAVAKTGKVYTSGKGSGLVFQDETAGGTARFGSYVTAPTFDKNDPDPDAQTVTLPASNLKGGYDPRIAGPDPWTPGPLAAQAPGYLKGQSADPRDKAGVEAAGRVLHAYTDSAPSAAEFVSGRKSYNNGINVLDDNTFAPTLFHTLQAQGWKLGTVTSVPFNHASPAAMYAHNVNRDDYQDLARDMLGLRSIAQEDGKEPTHAGLDVVIGTGFGQEASTRGLGTQGKNAVPGNLYITDADKAAIDVSRGGKYVVVQTTPEADGAQALAAAAGRAASGGHRLFGLFGSKALNHLPYRTADGRFDPSPDLDGKAERYTPSDLKEQPTLADMTRAALTVLSAAPSQPFALFIEAGDVDFALHKNNLDNAVGAVYSGEDAVRAVISWVTAHSNWDDSVLVIAADHGHYLVIDDLPALAGPAAKP
jgi:alkaline phosphatase